MLGSLRFGLALLVVFTHLGTWRWTGVYAVFGFYAISGYLMCLVLNQRYGFGPAGLRAYLTNRCLRIYPPYWFACLLAIGLIALLGEPAASALWGPWKLPVTAKEWIDNIGIVTLPTGLGGRIVPPSWALRVEVFYYVALGLGLGRHRVVALVWFVASAIYHIHLAGMDAPWGDRYFPIAAASLPFSIGALLYHTRDWVPARVHTSNALLALVVMLFGANLILDGSWLGPQLGATRFYCNLGLVTALVACLCMRRTESVSRASSDARLGDLAYPIYLIHMQIGLVVGSLGLVAPGPSTALAFTSLVPILLCAWLMLRLVDDPIERVREHVKRTFEARPALPQRGMSAE